MIAAAGFRLRTLPGEKNEKAGENFQFVERKTDRVVFEDLKTKDIKDSNFFAL